ncbi:protein Shroom3 isoform X2 [Dunckerocampus dactyliophorus]|uniref:protein Shroom3 isoform X2 n=1 Tax=Dunckerocampus dactyliophorus TaxID=161453 RepID=UPI0024053E0E|nr:protein Shroom3 isoform X2 [Dunckerocampus dactyliophorus]
MSTSFPGMDGSRVELQQASGGARGGGWVVVEARLQGGAPWGFTLQGGLEHGQPLIISKVEQGGKVDSLKCPLQVGDEIIMINDIELTGYRHEAIALVKGSYKTLHITVRREFDPGYIEEFGSSPPSHPTSYSAPSPPSLSSTSSPLHQKQQKQSGHSRPCSTGGVQLRTKNRRSEPSSRPHSWHSTKLGEGQQDSEQEGMDTMSSAWHHNYHASASTTDLAGDFQSDGGCLRKSPDQYSSRGSMESLDPPQSGHLQHHHALGQHPHSGPHPAYSSCQQLSSARSSNSIDHLHSKRDSAYSSFSTSSSIPEYLASAPTFCPERSYSLDTVPQKGGSGEMQQADVHYIRTVYNTQQELAQEQELTSTPTLSLRNSDSRSAGGEKGGQSRDPQGGGVCYRGSGSGRISGAPAANRHSVGPIWAPGTSHSSYENLRGVPAPPRRSDSYAAIKNHERPNSWSSVDHFRSANRSLQKSSWHHSSGPVAAKGLYTTEGQLHTVIEKSPESSPTTKPRQGFPPPGSPSVPSTGPVSPAPQSGRLILPTGIYPVPQPEPQYAQIPTLSPVSPTSGVYTALAKDNTRKENLQNVRGQEEEATEQWRDGIQPSSENGDQFNTMSPYPHTPSSTTQIKRIHESDSHRSMDQSDAQPEPVVSTRVAQGQVPPSDSPVHPQLQHPSSSQVSPRHYSDSAVVHYHHWNQKELDKDKEHPLTRLENALVEVQQHTGPSGVVSVSSYDNSASGEGMQGPTRSLSVLERVSRFEHRERAGKQRSQSVSHHKTFHWNQTTDKAYSAPRGAEDLRSMLERSTKAHRTMSYRGGRINCKKDRTTPDPNSALQRSISSLQLDGSTGDDGKTSWTQDVHNMLGSYQDTSFHRSHRDVQSKVVRSTSLRHNFSPTRTSHAAPPPISSSSSPSSHQPASLKHHPSGKRGPKTMPKPESIVISPPITSPHTPKERHVVGPETRGPSPPALPSTPPVGPPALLRICGRKRMTADQKKRSYSEPDNINEVGITDSETSSLFKSGGEASVADRRKMFELGFPNNAISRPDLRQLQQDALAQYVQRKKSAKKEEARQRSGPRPLSAYLQLENAYLSDTLSVSSTSSLLSLQDAGPTSSERHHMSSSPAADMRNIQSNFYYPGRVTTPRPPSHPTLSGDSPPERHTSISHVPHSCIPGADGNRHSPFSSRESPQQKAEPQQTWGGPRHLSRALQKAQSRLGSGKSASVEDLLERSEERRPHHSRSRSSPTVEIIKQDIPPSEEKMFDASITGPEHCAKTEDRLPDDKLLGGLSSPPSSHNGPAGSFSATFSHTPVSLRDKRQRNIERQRAHSASSLAASVGLPCPLTSRDKGGPEWPANEGLSQANQDATFPGTPQSSVPEGDGDRKVAAVSLDGHLDTLVMDKPMRHSLSEDMTKDTQRERTFSLDRKGELSKENEVSAVTSSPQLHFQLEFPPSSHQSIHQHLSSGRTPDVDGSTDQQPTSLTCHEDQDEVFLQNPAPPSSPPSIKETDITEDFPPPPHPILELNKNTSLQNAGSLPPSFKQQSSTLTSTASSSFSSLDVDNFEENLNLEYEPLLKREKTAEELRVETLWRKLVLQDHSLSSIFQGREGKSTVELVEGIFRNSRLGAKVPWHGSNINDRMEDGFSTEMDPRMEVDEDGKDINSKKVELCEALRCSVVALRQEKEALCEEQRRHQALGASIDSLVHNLCKVNERDKYSMFIGDLEKIMNLLLSLCSRLSRIDRSLLALQRDELTQEDTSEQRDSLHQKRSQLLSQTEDAWELKENLDRRQRVVHAILLGYLTEPQLQDYRHFVSTKPSLLTRQRNLDDLIRQREEQLTRLAETLPPELASARDRSGGSSHTSPKPTPCSSPFPQLTSGPSHSVRPTTVTSL